MPHAPTLLFCTLNHADPAEAGRICALVRRSYPVEAELIGVRDFPPLRRAAADIRDARSRFFGCLYDGSLVAVAEVEGDETAGWHIASFAVHPEMFRRGVGSSLLENVGRALGTDRLTVSTAAANKPAVALYEKHGFRIWERWSTGDGIDMVTLTRRAHVAGFEVGGDDRGS